MHSGANEVDAEHDALPGASRSTVSILTLLHVRLHTFSHLCFYTE